MNGIIPRNYGPPAVRRPNKIDRWIAGITEFTKKVLRSLGVTLMATLLGAGKDWLLRGADKEMGEKLSGNFRRDSEDKSKLYNPAGNGYGEYYSSNYRRGNGSDTFPGF